MGDLAAGITFEASHSDILRALKIFHVTLKAQHLAAAHLMKVVFPVEYWPTNRTMGLLSKSASSRAGEWNSWKR